MGRIACGQPTMAGENIEDYAEIPNGRRIRFCLICQGDSMAGACICDGHLVYIHSQPDVEDSGITAVRIGNEAY